MELTAVAVTKDRAGKRLSNMILTLERQVSEIIIIDENTDELASEEVREAQDYFGFTLLQSPRQIFNMPYAFNLALVECSTP
ncbi:unnamed protein product, partial [marine sediment metagenome]